MFVICLGNQYLTIMDGHRMEIYTQTFIAYEGFVELKTKFLIDRFTNYTG